MPKTITIPFAILLSVGGVVLTYSWTWKTAQETQTQQLIIWQAVSDEKAKTVNNRLDSIESKVDTLNIKMDSMATKHLAGG